MTEHCYLPIGATLIQLFLVVVLSIVVKTQNYHAHVRIFAQCDWIINVMSSFYATMLLLVNSYALLVTGVLTLAWCNRN